MSKGIISLKINRINSFPSVDSISSLSLLVNRIGESPSVSFEKIVVLHDNYLVSKDKFSEMKNHISDSTEDTKTSEVSRVYSENLKIHLNNLLGDLEEIYIVSGGFSNLEDQINLMEIVNHLFGNYKLNYFNTLDIQDKETDYLSCHSNLKKFFSYIS
jgi:DNA mismatch repair ATPase MutS